MEGFQGFSRPRVDRHNGTKKYAPGDVINIKNTNMPVFPIKSLVSATTSYKFGDIVFDGDYAYDTVSYNGHVYLRKYLKSIDARGQETYTSLLTADFSVSVTLTTAIVLLPDSDYMYLSTGGYTKKVKKSDLTVVKDVGCGYYVSDLKLSDDKSYLTVLSNESSSGTSISLRKFDLELNIITTLTSLESFNFSLVYINNRFVYGYGYTGVYVKYIIDTQTMTKYNVTLTIYDNTDYMAQKRSFIEGDYWYYLKSGNGEVFKGVLDPSAFSLTLVASIQLYAGSSMYTMFNYDENNIFTRYASNGSLTDVLISKKDMATITSCPQAFQSTPENSYFSFFHKQLNEFVYRNDAGTVSRTCLNLKITK